MLVVSIVSYRCLLRLLLLLLLLLSSVELLLMPGPNYYARNTKFPPKF